MNLAEAINLRKRDLETGLLVNHEYHFRADGSVDWLAEVPRKHMFVIDKRVPDVVKAQGKPIDECDLSLVNEKWLRIKQAGFNYLATLRGYNALDYHDVIAGDSKAALVCVIEWIGNYESDMEPFSCAGVASASTISVDKGFRPYLETFAENRAFARAVKRALQIPVLSEDEIDAEAVRGAGEEESSTSETKVDVQAYTHLEALCAQRKVPISFTAVKASAVKHAAELTPERANEALIGDPNKWTEWSSIEPRDVWLLIGKIKEADKAGKKTKP